MTNREGAPGSPVSADAETVEAWPALPYEAWKDTQQTLHMWTQIVGKIKLELCPYLNQWWEVALQLTARGLSTSLIPWRDTSFEIEFDFVAHRLAIRVSNGHERELPLEPRSVAEFYRTLMRTLAGLGIQVSINTLPSEVADGIRFERDTLHAAYDGAAAQRWWRVMLGVARIIERYRTPFHGKSSPVHFFWGAFDLNHARFNGNPQTSSPDASRMMEFGEDEENFSIGLWPGSDQSPHAVLYAYMAPAPEHIEVAQVQPEPARYEPAMGEFLLRYEDARRSRSPEQAIATFFQSSYEVSAQLAGWNRQALEGHVPNLTRSKARQGRG